MDNRRTIQVSAFEFEAGITKIGREDRLYFSQLVRVSSYEY